MPNHETNYVTVIGKPENIQSFIAEAFLQPGEPYPDSPDDTNDQDFPILRFNLILPQPANIERGGCSGGAVDWIHPDTGEVCWYAWNVQNWGTKWGAYSHNHYELRYFDTDNAVEGIYARLDLTFDTAWSQPTPIFDAIEQRWDVVVHAVTQDEGGYPDVEYGNPYDEGVIRRVVTFEFDSYDREATPEEASAN